MPSQEEYLDNLPNGSAPKQGEAEGTDDLQDIQELLQKTDNGENIGDEIGALVQEISQKEEKTAGAVGTAEKGGQTAHPAPDAGKNQLVKADKKKPLDKKQQRADKAAAKKAAKEAAKLAKKEEKAAKKKKNAMDTSAAKVAKPGKPSVPQEEKGRKPASETVISGNGEEANDGEELLFDTSVLDAIVSKAGLMDEQAIKEVARRGGQHQKDPDSETDKETQEQPLDDVKEEASQKQPSSGQDGQERSGVREVDISDADSTDFPTVDSADADIPDFPTVDLSEKDEADLDGIGEADAQDKGLFDKVMNLLTDEEGEGTQDASAEGLDALAEDADDEDQEEGEEAEKGKKGKKEKKAKKAKPKKDAKAKKAKKPKPKKQKVVKEKAPRKKIPLKKILPVVVLSVSIGIFILVVVNGSADYMDKQAAREAYGKGDYKTCYQNLFGKKRNEAEEEMYVKAESILYIRLWLREYEMFVEEGDEVKALDSLIQTVADYPRLYAYADQYSAGNEVYGEYTVILNILADKYGLSESQVLEIAAEPRDIVYTKIVTAIARGTSYSDWQEQGQPAEPDPSDEPIEDLPDVLPEEEDLGQDDFVGKF